MFGQQLASDVQQYLERLEKQRQLKVGADEASAGLTMCGDALRVPFLDFATATPKRHQTVVPGVGTLHDCCEHSPLFSAVARRLLFNSLVPAQLRGVISGATTRPSWNSWPPSWYGRWRDCGLRSARRRTWCLSVTPTIAF